MAAEWWRTATLYLLVHAVAVAVLADARREARLCLLGGAAIFAGTLYALSLGAPTWLGAITPIGGLLMTMGWLWLSLVWLKTETSDFS